MNDETDDVPVKEFVGLNRKMYSFLVADSSEHKKSKRCKQKCSLKMAHCEYKHVCWMKDV